MKDNSMVNETGNESFFLKLELIFAYFVSVTMWSLMTWQYYEGYGRQRIFMVVFGLFTMFCAIYGHEFKKAKKLNEQLTVIFIHPLILTCAVMTADSSMISGESGLIFAVFSLVPFSFFFLSCAAVFFINKQTNIGLWFSGNKYVLMVIAAAILLRIPFAGMMQRWDSGEYYWRFSTAVSEFTFTNFDEYMELFCLCNHPTMMFSLMYLPGELLFPGKIIGVSITSFIFTAIALWCMYRIILRCVKGTGEKSAAAYTALISFAPLFYGTAAYFNPDYAMACFFVITLYAFIYNKPVLAGVASLMCFQTKETGIVIVFGLVIGTFMRHLCSGTINGKNAIQKIASDACLYTTLAATCIQLWYMKTINGVSKWTQTGEDEPGLIWDNNGENCLGVNIPYIITKLKQQFVLNFNWLFTAIIIAGLILLAVKCAKDKKNKEKNEYIHCIAGGFIAFVVFSCLYITSPMARYNVVGDFLLYMIAMYVMERVIKVMRLGNRNTAVRGAQVVIGVLVAVECFVTIDPLTLTSFKMLDTGSMLMCYTGNSYTPTSEMYYGDYLVYNSQYTYIDKAYDSILKESGYDTSWDIIIPTSNGNFICGNMYTLNWDSTKKKRVFYESENTSQMKMYTLVEELKKSHSTMSDKAILLINPYYLGIDEQQAVDETLKYYSCVDQGEYKNLQGCIYYYILEK